MQTLRVLLSGFAGYKVEKPLGSFSQNKKAGLPFSGKPA
jgi:hypothetical protein